MTYDTLFHLAFYFAAILVSLTSIVFTKFQKRTDLSQNKTFLLMNYIVLANAVTCFLAEICDALMSTSGVFYNLLLVCQFLYFMVHITLAPALFWYVMTVAGSFFGRSLGFKLLCLLPYMVSELLVITNPLTKYVYYYTDDMVFVRNWGEIILYIVSIAYMAVAFTNLMLSWNALRRRSRWALVYFLCVTLFGVVVQFLYIGIKSELFCEALALVGVMLSIENEDDRLDFESGFYNRNALKMDVAHLLAKKRVMSCVCLKITNMDMVSRITGLSNTEEIIHEVADFVRTVVPRYCVYRATPGTLVIILRHDRYSKLSSDPQRVAEKLEERFKSDWTVHGSPLKLSPVIMTAEIPSHIHNLRDLLYMIDSPVPKDIDDTILSGEDLDFLIRREAVEAAVSKGLLEHNFEVYYQPTHCTDALKIHGAEALIRLHDKELGMLYPDEFIPIAEQTGNIDDIDEFVLKEVCAFIKSGEAKRLGMDCVNVNLSVIQCMANDFVKRIMDIVDSYGIPKSFINFEITESVAASDNDLLSDVITRLKQNGFQFSMDDYGTGYSNMHSLFALDFDIVKIDKSILWDADKSERGQIILENCVHMIKQMKRRILVEGVETREHVDKLTALGVDYLQGYFFSKPITQGELLKYQAVKGV